MTDDNIILIHYVTAFQLAVILSFLLPVGVAGLAMIPGTFKKASVDEEPPAENEAKLKRVSVVEVPPPTLNVVQVWTIDASTMENFLQDLAKERPVRFTSQQLCSFTNNYSKVLGSGGFGKVYKGRFPHGVKIAVKVLKKSLPDKRARAQFMAEIVGRRRNARVGSTDSLDWFPKLVWDEYEKDELATMILSHGIQENDRERAQRMAMVALWCVQDSPEARPPMNVVVKMLEGGVEIMPPPKPFHYLFSSKVEDDEVDRSKVDRDDRVEKEDHSINDMEVQGNKEADKDVNMEDGSGRLLEHAWTNNNCVRQLVNKQEKVPDVMINVAPSNLEIQDQHSLIRIQNRSKDLEEAEALVEVKSNTSHGLDSIVEDSCDPIKETYLNKLLQQKTQETQEVEVQSKERMEYVVQQKVVGENGLEIEDHLKELESNILLMDGPVVLGSRNNIRASQIPSINLQVELNPREARKALRKRTSQSCDSADNTNGVSGLQSFQQNIVLQELYANTIVGDKLGIEYTDIDIRYMKKLIEVETSNRFAPLQWSNSKH
ncbi:hypothetical protein Vadar_025032 [Vaccinium darrowii]|uniref:Uncharacterized protein n=1 Tax=Vaccinium darrowii TaxID=229202 RepID=A0ACB7X3Q6_9ERIC|nr:hypothetical protein Vadar_025032 [Vaccinium darrowii]